ncbi:MAG: hypothetical protein AAFP19_02885 [Bacteroidota bacterium]
MKKISFLFLFIHLLFSGYAQQDSTFQKVYYGPSITYGLSTYEGLGSGIIGQNLRGGFYYNRRLSKNWRINAGGQLSYFSEVKDSIDGLLDPNNIPIFFIDTIYPFRSGEMTYRSLLLAVPLRLEYYSKNNRKIGLVFGLTFNFRLYDDISWVYRNKERNSITDEIISEGEIRMETPRHKFLDRTFLDLGLQLNLRKLKITPMVIMESYDLIEVDWLSGDSRFTFLVELAWKFSAD